MVPNGKSTRNSDYRHAQSIGRQRQAAQAGATEASMESVNDVLPHDALPALPDASPADVSRPSWRDSEPAIVHSLTTTRNYKKRYAGASVHLWHFR